jgi:hypothetical protein
VCDEVKKVADKPSGAGVKGLVNLLATLQDTAPKVYRSKKTNVGEEVVNG